MRSLFLLPLLLVGSVNAKVPPYVVEIANHWNVPMNYVERWSWAESQHGMTTSDRFNRFGRFSIGVDLLKDYCRLRNVKYPSHPIAFLRNDRNNCQVAFYIYHVYVHKFTMSPMEFFQVWLFGARAVYEDGRRSAWYHQAIFGWNEYPVKWKFNRKVYEKYFKGVIK
jgi:hypothetical protein